MSITRRNSSGVSRVAGTAVPSPALLTRTSTRPKASIACSTTRVQSAGLVTSAGTARQRRPSASTRSRVCSSRSTRRAQTTTSAPHSASPSANATPSPDEAPVTMATLSSRRNRSSRDMAPPVSRVGPCGPFSPARRRGTRRRGEGMRQLTSVDAQFLAMETPRTYGHVAGLAVYDPSTAPHGELTVQDLCRLVSGRIHLLPPFRWRLAPVPLDIDLPYWIEDPDFDLDFHIRESAVPPPGTREQIARTVARIVSRPLDRAHPLWELYLLHGFPEGRVGVISKVHHAAVDGMSGAEILSVLLDPSPEGREVPPASPGRPETAPSQLGMLARGVA